MLNKYFLFFATCLFINSLKAQVGINIATPYSESILHIRSNKSSSDGYENDLIINNKTGYVGLGTSTPKARIDINGDFRFTDKSETDFSNSILTSNSDGVVSWKDFNKALRYKKLIWHIQDDNYPDITNSNNLITLTGTTLFSSTIAEAACTNNTLKLPKGRFLMSISAGLSNANYPFIYQRIKVLKGNDVVLESYFFNVSTNPALFLDLTEESTFSIQIEAIEVNSNPDNKLAIASTFPLVGPNKTWARVNVLTLDTVL